MIDRPPAARLYWGRLRGAVLCPRPADSFRTRLPYAKNPRSEVPAMLVIPGRSGKDTCDGITRRELLRVGGSAIFGFSLANLLGLQKASAKNGPVGGPGFGKAK